LSIVIPWGPFNPVEAKTERVPSGAIFFTTKPPAASSLPTNKFPAASKARPVGLTIEANVPRFAPVNEKERTVPL
jgi:hypothetical protein